MRASIKFAREIAKKCFRVNEVINGTEYIAVFDTKLCAQLVEEKFTSYNSAKPKPRKRSKVA
jgi:hypothetical protein